MTAQGYENFLSQKELECYLRGQIREYGRSHPISIDERQQLLRWMLFDNDLHSNPAGLMDSSGNQLDYLAYLRSDGVARSRNSCLDYKKDDGVNTTASIQEGGMVE